MCHKFKQFVFKTQIVFYAVEHNFLQIPYIRNKIAEMNSQSTKLELIKLLLETDEPSLLEKVRKILLPAATKRLSESIVGYKPNGEAITQKEFEEEMKTSIMQAENGEVISQEDLIKQAENW